jgi:hypothetical protein
MSALKTSNLGLIVALAIAFFGSEARAGYQSYTVSATYAQQLTNLTTTLSVPPFNSALGTLQSVTFTTSDLATVSANVTNTANTAETFTVAAAVSFAITFEGSKVVTDTLSAQNTFQNLASNQTATFGTYKLAGAGTPTQNSIQSNLLNFEGTTPLTFGFIASAMVSNGGQGGNVFINPTTKAGMTLNVSYTFSPSTVPEPASLTMTALGGLLVGAVGYVRHRKSNVVGC